VLPLGRQESEMEFENTHSHVKSSHKKSFKMSRTMARINMKPRSRLITSEDSDDQTTRSNLNPRLLDRNKSTSLFKPQKDPSSTTL
jgi:hypothetical protein